MSKRCSDTHFYLGGRKTASGEARYRDPVTNETLSVICGRRKAGVGEIHAGKLPNGARLEVGGVGSAPGVELGFYHKSSSGRKGRAEFNPGKVARTQGEAAAMSYALGAAGQIDTERLHAASSEYSRKVLYEAISRSEQAAKEDPRIAQARSAAIRAATVDLISHQGDYSRVSSAEGRPVKGNMLFDKVVSEREFFTLMNDPGFINDMAVDSEDASIRAGFMGRVTNPYVLFAAAISDPDANVRFEAISRISEPEILLRVLENDNDQLVAEAAAARLAYINPEAYHGMYGEMGDSTGNDSYTKNGVEYTRAGTASDGTAVYACSRPGCPCSGCPGTPSKVDRVPTHETSSGARMTISDAWTRIDMPDSVLGEPGKFDDPFKRSAPIVLPDSVSEETRASAAKATELARRLNDVARQYDWIREKAAESPSFDYESEVRFVSDELVRVSRDVNSFASDDALVKGWGGVYETENLTTRLQRQCDAMEVIVDTAVRPEKGIIDEHVGTLLATRVGLTDRDQNWAIFGPLLDTPESADLNPGSTASAPASFGSALVGLTRRGPKGKREILMVATKRNPNQFQPVGGRVDPGEEHLETALREVKEEVGLELSEQQLHETMHAGMFKRQGDMVFYAAEVTDEVANSLRLDDPEFESPARWMSLEEALEQPAFPSTKSFIRKLMA